MKRLTAAALILSGGMAQADVLGLTDYDALFVANADTVEILANGAEAIETTGGVFVSRQNGDIITLDQSTGGAVGCFVSLLAQVESYQQACNVTFDAGQLARVESYRTQALTFYAANVSPATTFEIAKTRYDNAVSGSLENSLKYCAPDSNIAIFMDSFLVPETQDVINRMTAVPRLPADNPCL